MQWYENRVGNRINNLVASFDGFFISYNPQEVENPMDDMLALLNGVPLTGVPETAIVIESLSGTNFYILEGDWRAEYERLGPLGLEACMEFFRSMREHRSQFSDTEGNEHA